MKAEPFGSASTRLQRQLHIGDSLGVAAPRGSFILTDDERPVVLISAGVGATPVLAMLHALADERTGRSVWWLHGARDRADHAFATESRALLDRIGNAQARICYSRPGRGDRVGIDYTDNGHIDADLLDRAGVPVDADAYVCGPAAFMTALTDALLAHGLAGARIRTEVFGARAGLTPGIGSVAARAPHPPPGRPGSGQAVTFARTGLEVPWNDRCSSLLELAESCDVPVRWSCRTGVCHTCETAILSGTASYDIAPLEPPAQGNLLICCSHPGSDVVLDL